MNWMDFVLDIVELTIWPFTLLMSLVILRSPLGLLLPFAQSIRYKDFELQFSQDLNQVRQDAHSDLEAWLPERDQQRLVELASHLPNHGILEAWSHVELSAEKLLLKRFPALVIPTEQRYKFLGKALLEHNLIDEKQSKLFHELRRLRNRVAHAKGFEVNALLSQQYINICFALSESLGRQALDEA